MASTTAFYVQSDLVHLLRDSLSGLHPSTEVAGEVSSSLIILVFCHETDAELLDPLKTKALAGVYTNNTLSI